MTEHFCYSSIQDVLTRSELPIEQGIFREKYATVTTKYLRMGELIYFLTFTTDVLPSHMLLVPEGGMTEITRLRRENPIELDAGFAGLKVLPINGLWRLTLGGNSSDLQLPVKTVALEAKQRTLEIAQGIDPTIEVALV